MNYRHTCISHSHTISNHTCIQTHIHSSRYTATHYIYNLRTLKKTSSILYSHNFWVSIQPFWGNGWTFFFNYCFVQCNLSFHWKLLPNVTFTASLVLHTNSNSSTNHMNKSSHILVSAMVQGKRKFLFILETTLDFTLYITIFILWIVNKSHAQKNCHFLHIS